MIAVATSTALAKALHQYKYVSRFPEALAKDYKLLKAWLDKHLADLQPTFPDTDNEQLLIHFQLTSPKHLTQSDLDSLLRVPGIKGAYEKPSDDIPS